MDPLVLGVGESLGTERIRGYMVEGEWDIPNLIEANTQTTVATNGMV